MRKLTRRQDRQKRRVTARMFVRALKDNPCTDCGVKYHYSVMQFDHVRGIKKMDINRMVHNRYAIDSIKKEVAKCELVCANCHAYRTWLRHNSGDVNGE